MISGPAAVIRGFPFSMTRQPAQAQSEWVIPLAKAHRPLTRTPPLPRMAPPEGAAIPAHGAEGLANTLLAPASGMYPATTLFPKPTITHQPVDPSAAATVSIRFISWIGSASSPPSA